MYVYMHVCMYVCVYVYVHGVYVEVRGQLSGVSSLLPPHGSWVLNSVRSGLAASPFPTEPSLQPQESEFLSPFTFRAGIFILVAIVRQKSMSSRRN